MKKSKRPKASSRSKDGVDMISKVPDSILHLILSCLSTTEEVIRTSILSTRWRYLWTSIPSIDIAYFRGLKPPKKFESNKFREFVYWVLANKSLDLDSFRLSCSSYYSMSTVGRWIHLAYEKRQTTLLDVLSLIRCMRKLKYLCISCPKLKKLRIDNVDDDDGFLSDGIKISCPKLADLEFAGHIANRFSVESLDCLKKVVIRPEYTHMEEIYYDPRGDTIRDLFAQICHVESLSLTHYFIEALDVPISLPNLKNLELTTTCDAYIMEMLIDFLVCVPNLESLHLIIQEEIFTKKHWELDNEETRRILAPYLKKIEFLEFKGESLKLVSLLKHGYASEEMVFNWDKFWSDKLTETMNEVSKFHKASSTVRLITLLEN